MNVNLYRLAYKNERGIVFDWFYLKGSDWRYYSYYTRQWQTIAETTISLNFRERSENISVYHVKNFIEK